MLNLKEIKEQMHLSNLVLLLNSRELDYFELPSLKPLIGEIELEIAKVYHQAQQRESGRPSAKPANPRIHTVHCGSCHREIKGNPGDHVCVSKRQPLTTLNCDKEDELNGE